MKYLATRKIWILRWNCRNLRIDELNFNFINRLSLQISRFINKDIDDRKIVALVAIRKFENKICSDLYSLAGRWKLWFNFALNKFFENRRIKNK
jgi:hypothetical protein